MSLCTLAYISMSNLLPSLSGVFIIIFFLGAHVMELNWQRWFSSFNKVHQGKRIIGSKLWSECVYIKIQLSPATNTIGQQMWPIFHWNHPSYPNSSHKLCLHPIYTPYLPNQMGHSDWFHTITGNIMPSQAI